MRRSLVILLTAAACSKSSPPPVDPGAVEISPTHVVRTDTVGLGQEARASTFVLVDAKNTGSATREITLGGDLLDASGAVIGHLRPESLVMQAGASRTFALVDDADTARPTATDARLTALAAGDPGPAPPITLTDGHAFDDAGKVMVAANLTNTGDKPAQVLVLSSFHDASGTPMSRPFELLQLAAGEKRVVRYDGPMGSKDGSIFLGAESY